MAFIMKLRGLRHGIIYLLSIAFIFDREAREILDLVASVCLGLWELCSGAIGCLVLHFFKIWDTPRYIFAYALWLHLLSHLWGSCKTSVTAPCQTERVLIFEQCSWTWCSAPVYRTCDVNHMTSRKYISWAKELQCLTREVHERGFRFWQYSFP